MINIRNARVYCCDTGRLYKLYSNHRVETIVSPRKESSTIFIPYEKVKKSFKEVLEEEIRKQKNNSTEKSK